MFNNLTTEGLEKSEDRLGGYAPLTTDAYPATIKVAYATTAASGAKAVNLVADINGQEYRETIYVTNKKGENFFLNKQDNTKKVALPGFTTIEDICLVATNKGLAQQTVEEKVIKIYDFDQKKEVPTSMPVLTELTGANVTLGIVNNLENKSEKKGDEYVPTADTRETNSIEKVFDTGTKFTVAEATNNAPEAAFYPAWVERNKGKQRDKRTIKDGSAGQSGKAPQAGQTSTAPRTSLFGAKN